jgi:hypothetical protein
MIDEALRPALDVVEHSWHATRDKQVNDVKDSKGAGALIIVGRRDQDKFFSNGFDYEAVKGNMSFFPGVYNDGEMILIKRQSHLNRHSESVVRASSHIPEYV